MNNPVSRIERWAAMISDCLATILAGILLSAQNVFHAVLDLLRHGPQARRRLQLKARPSKLEAIGQHCELFRRNQIADNGAVRNATADKTLTKADDDRGPARPECPGSRRLNLMRGPRLRLAVTNTLLIETGFAQHYAT